MNLTPKLWSGLANYGKSLFFSQYDPTVLVPELSESDLEEFRRNHKGFYIGVRNSSQEDVALVGFMEENLTELDSSLKRVIHALKTELDVKQVPVSSLHTSKFYFTIINKVEFTNNGLFWNENEDGIYFSWGDRYKGLYLPYQIKEMNIKKTEIMNRLCSYEAHVPSNLWRLPEGMCSRIICDSYTIY